MKNSKKPILITVTVLAIALIGYMVTDGTFNMSPSDAAGSGIDGIKHTRNERNPLVVQKGSSCVVGTIGSNRSRD